MGDACLQVRADPSMLLRQRLITRLSIALAELPSNSIGKCAMPTFDMLFPTEGVDPDFVPEPIGDFDMDDHGLVMHSSGLPLFHLPHGQC